MDSCEIIHNYELSITITTKGEFQHAFTITTTSLKTLFLKPNMTTFGRKEKKHVLIPNFGLIFLPPFPPLFFPLIFYLIHFFSLFFPHKTRNGNGAGRPIPTPPRLFKTIHIPVPFKKLIGTGASMIIPIPLRRPV